MRHLLLVFALILAGCSPREDTTQIRLTEADLHEFIVMAGLLETGQSDLAIARFATLEIGENNQALERLAMQPERETIALSPAEPLPETTVRPVRRQYDGFLDYTLFGLGGAALQSGDDASLETIITLLRLRREVTNTEILFNNCRRALLADVLIELRDEALNSDEIFDLWQSGTAGNEACDFTGSGGQAVFWQLFDDNYVPAIQTHIVEHLQQSGMQVTTYAETDACVGLHGIEGLSDILNDGGFAEDVTLDGLRDQAASCAMTDPVEAFRAAAERQSGPSLDELVAQDLIPADLAAYLTSVDIDVQEGVCPRGFASEDPECAGEVVRLIHEPASERWAIYLRDQTGTHLLAVGRTETGYEILSRFFFHPYF